ncbi:hypothetical protein V6N11_036363 [Hibiscus sabdariffa]|uniref:Uncharacterized protein n=1 Tax=Hibiscus sabdariffa TaxID=183260 RepID=A0ABR2RAA5_9ROSI
MFGDTELCIVEKQKIPEYIEKEENNEVGELNKSSLLLLMKQVKYLGDIYQVLSQKAGIGIDLINEENNEGNEDEEGNEPYKEISHGFSLETRRQHCSWLGQGKSARVLVSDSTTREEGVGVGSELCNAGERSDQRWQKGRAVFEFVTWKRL